MRLEKNKILFFVFLLFLTLTPSLFKIHAQEAVLFVYPSSNMYQVGDRFSVSIRINSDSVGVNAVDGSLSFDQDKLEVVGISKSGSIFNLWLEEPSFSNTRGTISFGGGKPSPGYSGSSGKIISITLKGKAPGHASLNFTSGSALADDGMGTNVLSQMRGAEFTFSQEEAPPAVETPPEPADTGLSAPLISSPTHPDPEAWYDDSSPVFRWEVPSGVTGTRLLVSREIPDTPTVFYGEPISERKLEELEDGTWYFYVQLRSQYGWSETSHFKFNIDTEPPEPFEINIKEGSETTHPQPTLILDVPDEASGVDLYKIKIGQLPLLETDKKEFQVPELGIGSHTIIVKAIDKAGNSMIGMREIKILPIERPTITFCPEEIISGSLLVVRGTGLAEAEIEIGVEETSTEASDLATTKADKAGNWTYIHPLKLKRGVYKVRARTIDKNGAKSLAEEKTVIVSPPVFLKVGERAISYLSVLVVLASLLALLSFIFMLGIKRFKNWRREIRRETEEVEESVVNSFINLAKKVDREIRLLDKKEELSDQEKKIRDSLKTALEESEGKIRKEIEDIKKET